MQFLDLNWKIKKEENKVQVLKVKNRKIKMRLIVQSNLYYKKLYEPQNPRFTIKSGFKSRGGYNL